MPSHWNSPASKIAVCHVLPCFSVETRPQDAVQTAAPLSSPAKVDVQALSCSNTPGSRWPVRGVCVAAIAASKLLYFETLAKRSFAAFSTSRTTGPINAMASLEAPSCRQRHSNAFISDSDDQECASMSQPIASRPAVLPFGSPAPKG